MNLKCHECLDIAIKNGISSIDEVVASDAISLFPVMQVMSTSAGMIVTNTALPLCWQHRSLQAKKSSSALLTA